ncbi:MAG: hypothetical protein JO340_16030 [Acidobacteriaceae bacterium]|nr:hypothetical protein [Acidobacteriaceae bacterium]
MPPRMSRRDSDPKRCAGLALSASRLGHSSPQHCPIPCPLPCDADALGSPLAIRDVAALIGCSVWTVRQKYLPLGLPHFRTGPTGKLLFYKTQVIRWLIGQQKGGA